MTNNLSSAFFDKASKMVKLCLCLQTGYPLVRPDRTTWMLGKSKHHTKDMCSANHDNEH